MCHGPRHPFFIEMKDIFSIALEAAADGMTVDIDLNWHSLAINGGSIIDHGQWQGELGVAHVDEHSALTQIEAAYAAFHVSVPEHSPRDRSRWFKALKEDELTDSQYVSGDDRPLARCRLEALTLALVLNGSLTPQGPQMRGRWFWQSKVHPSLVILTQWLDLSAH